MDNIDTERKNRSRAARLNRTQREVQMRLLVCGGRNYDEREMVWRTLDQYQENYGPLTVIQGGAPGADHWAREWAHQQIPAQEVTLVSVPADWEKWGTAAGPKRNQMCWTKSRTSYWPFLAAAAPPT
jgi:hypothetical protein